MSFRVIAKHNMKQALYVKQRVFKNLHLNDELFDTLVEKGFIRKMNDYYTFFPYDANGNDLHIYFPKNRQFIKEDFTVEQKDGTRTCVV